MKLMKLRSAFLAVTALLAVTAPALAQTTATPSRPTQTTPLPGGPGTKIRTSSQPSDAMTWAQRLLPKDTRDLSARAGAPIDLGAGAVKLAPDKTAVAAVAENGALCGRIGCPTYLWLPTPAGTGQYSWITVFDDQVNDLEILDHTTNGLHDLRTGQSRVWHYDPSTHHYRSP
jgi:hypothetical protein